MLSLLKSDYFYELQYNFITALRYTRAHHGIMAIISPKFSDILQWTSIHVDTNSFKLNKRGLKKPLNSCSISFFTNFEYIMTNTEAVPQKQYFTKCSTNNEKTGNFRYNHSKAPLRVSFIANLQAIGLQNYFRDSKTDIFLIFQICILLNFSEQFFNFFMTEFPVI